MTTPKTHTVILYDRPIATHLALGILVGAGLQQQPHAVRLAHLSGRVQRGHAVLLVLGLLVGAGLRQQTHHVRVTLLGGQNQRRAFFLRACESNVPQRADQHRMYIETKESTKFSTPKTHTRARRQ